MDELHHAKCDWPSELDDARNRLKQAKVNFESLKAAIDKFHYEYVGRMVGGFNPEEGAFTIYVLPPSESYVGGESLVLVAQIAENVRAVLDYVVFQLSKQNEPNLTENVPAFVIADTKEAFVEARWRLRYLTAEQVELVEQLQPYNGNVALDLLKDVTNPAKHRYLLRVLDLTSGEVCLDSMDKQSSEYKDWFAYPAGDGVSAIFARRTEQPRLRLLEDHDAFEVLGSMISLAEMFLWAASHWFCPHQASTPKFNIVFGKPPSA